MTADNSDTRDTEPTESTPATSTATDGSGTTKLPVSRRAALGSLLGLGLLSSPALADNRNLVPWRRDRNAREHDLVNLGSVEMAADPTAITEFAGANLDVDEGGALNVDASGVSHWEDADGDGLLEAPDSDGIAVGTVKANSVETEGDSETEGDHTVGGSATVGEYVDVAQPGVQVHLPLTSHPEIASQEETTVNFTRIAKDPRDEFDTEDNAFRPDVGGDYRVNVQIGWFPVPDGTNLETNVHLNGERVFRNEDYMPVTHLSAAFKHASVSKVLVDIEAGDAITVSVSHNAATDDFEKTPLLMSRATEDTYAEFIRVG